MATCDELEPTNALPSIPLHPSHTYIVTGGYAGCIKCGGVAGVVRSPLLVHECRGFSQPNDLVWRVRLLAKGHLPYSRSIRKGLKWTSGELTPQPRRWAPPISAAREGGIVAVGDRDDGAVPGPELLPKRSIGTMLQ